jgi:hypothetical protein
MLTKVMFWHQRLSLLAFSLFDLINDLYYVWKVCLDIKVILIMGHCASELKFPIHFS